MKHDPGRPAAVQDPGGRARLGRHPAWTPPRSRASANPSPLSIGWGIDDYFALLAEAADKAVSVAGTLTSRRRDVADRAASGGVRRPGCWFAVALRGRGPDRAWPRSPFGARCVGWRDIVAALGGTATRIGAGRRAEAHPADAAGACSLGAALGAGRRGDAGRHPQPARRPRHPRRQHGRLAGRRHRHRVLRAGLRRRPTSGWPSPARRSRRSSSTRSARSGRGGATPLKLALAGAATSAAFARWSPPSCCRAIDVMNAFRFWQIGGVGGATFGSHRAGAAVPRRRAS